MHSLIFCCLVGRLLLTCFYLLRAGYLLPWSGANPIGPTAVGAIELAYERIQELQLLPFVELEWLWHDSYVHRV